MGPCYGTDKWQALQGLDILVQASRNEGLPGAVLEAAASKVPAIVSMESNMGDYVTQYEAGLCLPHNDAPQIAKALCKLVGTWHTGELARMRQNALNMVQTEFSWTYIAQRLAQQYENVMQPC